MATIPNVLSLFGGGSTATLGTGTSALAEYTIYQKNGPKQFEQFKQQKTIQKAVADFREAVANIDSPEAFVKNRKAMDFAMRAFFLGGSTEDYGLTRRAITQSLDDEKALANRLTDTRYKKITEAFDFAKSGVDKLKDTAFVDDLVNRYLQNEFERSIGDKNSAVRDAIVFRRSVGDITKTVDILGNALLRRVVTTALQLPDQIALQSVKKQISLVDDRIDTTKFMLNPTSSTTTTLGTLTPTQRLANADKGLSILDNTRSVVKAIVDQLSQLDTDYATLDATIASRAAERPRQEIAIPQAVTSRGAYEASIGALQATEGGINGAINAIGGALSAIAAGGSDPAQTPAQQYQWVIDKITQLRDQMASAGYGSYQGQSLARATDDPATFTDGAKTVSSIELTSALTVDVKARDVSSALDGLNQALAALGGYTAGGAEADLDAARSALLGAQTVVQAAQGTLGADLDTLNAGLSAMEGWAVPMATADLYAGSQLAATGRTALTNVQDIVGQMRILAMTSLDSGYTGDRAALDAEFKTLAASLSGALDGADATDPSTGEVRNLLRAGTGSYTFDLFADGTTSITAPTLGIDGKLDPVAADIAAGTAGIGDRDAAASVLARLTGIEVDLAQASANLSGTSKAFALASVDIDPRGSLDARYRNLATLADASIGLATFQQVNLLNAQATDVTLNSNDLPGSPKLEAQPEMRTLVADRLAQGAAGLPGTGPFDQTNPARVALVDALIEAQRVQMALDTNRAEIKTVRDQAQRDVPDSANSADDPFDVKATAFTDQFIRRYLITVDSQSSSLGTQAQSSYSVALGLLGSARGNTSLFG
jgi:hypothetical protein